MITITIKIELGYGDLSNYKWGMILAPGFESS